jgi:GT2 family glycosyltransferase
MENPLHHRCGALTGTTLGYDIVADKPTGKYDSTGVFHTWYGHWFDRGQGQACQSSLYDRKESIPAICGAIYFARKKALDTVMLRNYEVFDNSFYMYKEDIDLSLRLRRKRWTLDFVPDLIAYHCRGWNRDRSKMPRELRLCSAKNELIIHTRNFMPVPTFYAVCKYAAVKLLDM